jgi:hypothetical protein
MPSYRDHPSKATRLEEGEFVVLEDADAADCTVWIFFGRDGQGDELWEGLLSQRIAPDRARICAVPVWVYNLNLGDEVAVVESEAPVATHPVRGGGQHTYRVSFDRETGSDWDGRWRGLMADLERYGCWFDIYNAWLVALSVEHEHLAPVDEYLKQRAARGELEYEAGRTGRPGPQDVTP